MHPTLRFLRVVSLVALALAAGACNRKTTGSVNRQVGVLTPTVELDFPRGSIATEAVTLRVRGRSSGPRAIAAVDVNGVHATSSDNFAHWQLDVPLVNGVQSIVVDATDVAGLHAQANASVERVPRVLPRNFDTSSDLTLDAAAQRVFITETDTTHSLVGATIATVAPTFVCNALDGSGTTLELPIGTAFDAAHSRVIVWDQSQNAHPRVTAVDPATGACTLLSDSSRGSGPMPAVAETLAVDSAGANAYALDLFAPVLYAIDLATGDRTIISDASHGSGPLPGFGSNVALDEAHGRLVVADDANVRVVVVDFATGDRSVLSDNAGKGTGPALVDPKDLAVAPGRGSALVADASGKILEVDLATGNRTLLSGGSAGTGPALGTPFRIDVSEALGFAMVYASSNGPRMIRVALASGDRSDFAHDPVRDAGASLHEPADVAVDPARDRILVLESEEHAIVAIDRTTGAKSTVSGGSPLVVGNGPQMDDPVAFVVDATKGRAYVTDDTSPGTVFAVDLASGDRTILSDQTHGSGPLIGFPSSIALDLARGRLVVLDDDERALVAVDLVTGDRTVLTDGSTGGSPLLEDPIDVAVDDANGRALVSDGLVGVVAVDLATGQRTLLSGPAAGNGPAFVGVGQLALDPERARVIVADALVADGNAPARLVAVDLASGDRSILADDSGAHGEGTTLADVVGLVFDPTHDLFLACDVVRRAVVVIDAELALRGVQF